MKQYWRPSKSGELKTAKSDVKRIFQTIKQCGLPLEDNFLKSRPQPHLFDFEKRYLSRPALVDRQLASSEHNSTAYLLHSARTMLVGDTLSVRVDVCNHRGDPMSLGGDEVRVWFKGHNNEGLVRFSADVTDLHNGSYLATARLVQHGEFQVNVGLAHSSDFTRTLLQIHLLFKSLHWSVGLFSNADGSVDEATPCTHQSNIPFHKHDEVCNLTDVNGSPWYCGKPRNIYLSCKQFLGTLNVPNVIAEQLPVSPAQLAELKRSMISPRIRLIEVAGGSNVNVTQRPDGVGLEPSKIPCNRLPAKQTWSQTSTGYLFNPKSNPSNNTWIDMSCRKTIHLRDDQSKCFRNMTVHVFGDSNSREHYITICRSTRAKNVAGLQSKYLGWHSTLKCQNPDLNFTSWWHPHANPFTSSQSHWAINLNARMTSGVEKNVTDAIPSKGLLVPTSIHLDAISSVPSTGRMLVILHQYYHLTMYHTSAYQGMQVSIRDAVKRLLERNPEAIVVVRGPHSTYGGWKENYVCGDGLARFMEEILLKIWGELSETGRVFYLRTWDMTIATENSERHPRCNVLVNNRLVNFICDR